MEFLKEKKTNLFFNLLSFKTSIPTLSKDNRKIVLLGKIFEYDADDLSRV